MPTTRKQKNKARKTKEADMLTDLENMDITLGSNHFEREDSEFEIRPDGPKTLVKLQ